MDGSTPSARLLGVHVAAEIGTSRLSGLLQRWQGDIELLTRQLVVRTTGAPASENKRREPYRAHPRPQRVTAGSKGERLSIAWCRDECGWGRMMKDQYPGRDGDGQAAGDLAGHEQKNLTYAVFEPAGVDPG